MADLEAITKALDEAKVYYIASLGAQADLDRISAEQGALIQRSEAILAESKRRAEATMAASMDKAMHIQKESRDKASQIIDEAQKAVAAAENLLRAHVDKTMKDLKINVDPVVSAGGGHTRL